MSGEADKMDSIRTCVGCRQKDKRSALMRVVVSGSALIIDVRRGASGRGCHVHDRADCVSQAVQRKAFTRALRVTTAVDTTHLENRLK